MVYITLQALTFKPHSFNRVYTVAMLMLQRLLLEYRKHKAILLEKTLTLTF